MSGSAGRTGTERFSYVRYISKPSFAGTSKCLHWKECLQFVWHTLYSDYLSPFLNWPILNSEYFYRCFYYQGIRDDTRYSACQSDNDSGDRWWDFNSFEQWYHVWPWTSTSSLVDGSSILRVLVPLSSSSIMVSTIDNLPSTIMDAFYYQYCTGTRYAYHSCH